jgi:putative MFS transporter
MRGAGFCNTVGRFFTILAPQIGAALFIRAGVAGVVTYVSSLLILQVIVTFALGMETKRRSLESLSHEAGFAHMPAPEANPVFVDRERS